MTADYVWVGDWISPPTLFEITDLSLHTPDVMGQVSHLNHLGKPVPSDMFPRRLWGDPKTPPGHWGIGMDLPNIMEASGHFVVSERFAKLLSGFDLGQGCVRRIEEGVYFADNKTRAPLDLYCWTLGNSKAAFLPDATTNKKPFSNIKPTMRWRLQFELKDWDIAVSTRALQGPDVWVEDNLGFSRAIFLSTALGDAIIAAGLDKDFPICKCRVLSED